MYINKNKKTVKASIKASNRRVARRPIKAAEEEEIEEIDEPEVEVAPEASDLLFEAEDVAELVAEVTGQEVAVTAEDDVITFEVGDDVFTVEAEGDEEILESTKVDKRDKAPVKASRKVTANKAVARRRARR